MPLWLNNGKLVFENGKLVLCNYCPCDDASDESSDSSDDGFLGFSCCSNREFMPDTIFMSENPMQDTDIFSGENFGPFSNWFLEEGEEVPLYYQEGSNISWRSSQIFRTTKKQGFFDSSFPQHARLNPGTIYLLDFFAFCSPVFIGYRIYTEDGDFLLGTRQLNTTLGTPSAWCEPFGEYTWGGAYFGDSPFNIRHAWSNNFRWPA